MEKVNDEAHGIILSCDELKKDAENIRACLFEACRNRSDLEPNFIIASGICSCCFYRKRLYIIDNNFYPMLAYESKSYIASCSISNDARYAVFQMARNAEMDEDSGATAILDVKRKEIIARRILPTGFNGTRHIFVDPARREIYIYIADSILGEDKNIVVKYNFELQADEKSLEDYYNKPDISPYIQNSRVTELIEDVNNKKRDVFQVRKEINRLLDRLIKNENMSSYQLSLTYKELGDMYYNNGMKKEALNAYTVGLSLNGKLAVKKKIAELKKS